MLKIIFQRFVVKSEITLSKALAQIDTEHVTLVWFSFRHTIMFLSGFKEHTVSVFFLMNVYHVDEFLEAGLCINTEAFVL